MKLEYSKGCFTQVITVKNNNEQILYLNNSSEDIEECLKEGKGIIQKIISQGIVAVNPDFLREQLYRNYVFTGGGTYQDYEDINYQEPEITLTKDEIIIEINNYFNCEYTSKNSYEIFEFLHALIEALPVTYSSDGYDCDTCGDWNYTIVAEI